MPLIGDFKQKKTKKFVKKEYRPWDEEILELPDTDTLLAEEKNNKMEDPLISLPISEGEIDPLIDTFSETQENLMSIKEEEITDPFLDENNSGVEKHIRGLYGVQRGLLQVIMENISYQEEGFFISKPLSGSHLCLSLKAPITSVKGSIQRLIKAKIISLHEFKPGRGGFSCYKIPEEYGNFIRKYFEFQKIGN